MIGARRGASSVLLCDHAGRPSSGRLNRDGRVDPCEVDQPSPVFEIVVFHVERERLLGSRSVSCPPKDFVNVPRSGQPMFVAVIPHVLLRNFRRGRRLVPEVRAVHRLFDFPFNVAGIDAFDDHQPTLRPRPRTALYSAQPRTRSSSRVLFREHAGRQ